MASFAPPSVLLPKNVRIEKSGDKKQQHHRTISKKATAKTTALPDRSSNTAPIMTEHQPALDKDDISLDINDSSSPSSETVLPGAVRMGGIHPALSDASTLRADDNDITSASSNITSPPPPAPIVAIVVDKDEIEGQIEDRVQQRTNEILENIRSNAVEAEIFEEKPTKARRLFVAAALLVVIVVVVVIVVAVVITQKNKNKSSPTAAPTSFNENPYFPYYEAFANATGNDLVFQAGTPHQLAANWITQIDSLNLTLDSNHLIQRFLSALFYYQMSDNGRQPWISCFAPIQGESDGCSFSQRTLTFKADGETVNSNVTFLEVGGQFRWLSGQHECHWAGITCGEGTVVQGINLVSQNLTGTLPPELSGFSSLVNFSVPLNRIEGTIPSAYSKLTSLLRLELHYNLLRGNFSETLYRMTNLQNLNLGNNSITGTLTTKLGLLSNLLNLDLFINSISGTIPNQVGKLTQLSTLALDNNRFEGTIPTTMSGLTSLEVLWLFSNQLNGTMPTAFGSMTSLTALRLGFNHLSGSIPTQLWNLSNLKLLDLITNRLTGTLSNEITLIQQLKFLYLSGNTFSGTIPSEIGNLTNLELLVMTANGFNGRIPSSLGMLTELTNLYLEDNTITGTLPSSLGSLDKLQALDVSVNFLTGTIPTELATLSNLVSLNFTLNNFQGALLSPLILFCDGTNLVPPSWQIFATDCLSQQDGGVAVVCPCCTECCGRRNGVAVCQNVTL